MKSDVAAAESCKDRREWREEKIEGEDPEGRDFRLTDVAGQVVPKLLA
jgi:hypothetical protein